MLNLGKIGKEEIPGSYLNMNIGQVFCFHRVKKAETVQQQP